jgi:hypothetical protein
MTQHDTFIGHIWRRASGSAANLQPRGGRSRAHRRGCFTLVTVVGLPYASLLCPFRYRLGEFPVHFLNDLRKLAASENPMRSAT